ncbi:MAG: heme exporter protein CcmD [Nitrospira sp.]|jgi:heme exporter protein D|nr:heme exporter protein CcmD [Nitrospira sp.]THJ22614.1 MAG: heme exporter protein CcmD [Nitrospira sp. CG24D]
MQWNSLNEFLAMGGYGVYVWPSFGVTALCMIWEVLILRRRHAAARTALNQSVASAGVAL